MKIMFIGAVESSKILLEKLINMKENIISVITSVDTGFNSDFVDLSIVCEENSIEYNIVEDINHIDVIKYMKDKNPDVIYCFGFSQLLSKEIINIPKHGVIGFHPTQLPHNRGRHPLIWAIALGLSETASTFFFINEGADNGDIISQEIIPIYYKDNAMDLYSRVLNIAKKQVETLTNELKEEGIKGIKQDEKNANYWRKRRKEDGRIDWRMSSNNIYNLVRALTHPYVGAHLEYKSKDVKVWRVEERIIEDTKNIEPGKILEVFWDGSFLVKTGDNCIHVLECGDIDIKVGDYL